MDEETNGDGTDASSGNGRGTYCAVGSRPKLIDVNSFLKCHLCCGYLIDAVTITDCLHTFCRSCILLHLRTTFHCPVCNHPVSTTHPNANLLPDHLLQDLTYKLIPGLYRGEVKRRTQFQKTLSSKDISEQVNSSFHAKSSIPEDFTQISLVLERTACIESEIDRQPYLENVKKLIEERTSDRIYLLCSLDVTIAILKKLIRHKMNLDSNREFRVCIYCFNDFLKDYYSLQDIAEMYSWQMKSPLHLFFTILDSNECSWSTSEVLLRSSATATLKGSNKRPIGVKLTLRRTRSQKKGQKRRLRLSSDSLSTSLPTEKHNARELCDSFVSQTNVNISDSRQSLDFPRGPMRNGRRIPRASGHESELLCDLKSAISADGSIAPQSFYHTTIPTDCDNKQKLRSMSKKEMLLTRLCLKSSPDIKTSSPGNRTTNSVNVTGESASNCFNSGSVGCDLKARFMSDRSLLIQNYSGRNCSLPFKKRRRSSVSDTGEISPGHKAAAVSTATPNISRTSGSSCSSGLPFKIYEDAAGGEQGTGMSPLPKVGVVICRGRVMTLQDRQRMLTAASSSLSQPSHGLAKDKPAMHSGRDSESENLGSQKTHRRCRRRKRSKGLETRDDNAAECSDSDLSKKLSASSKPRNALCLRGNIPTTSS